MLVQFLVLKDYELLEAADRRTFERPQATMALCSSLVV